MTLYCTTSLCDIWRSPTSNRSQLFYCYMHVIDGSPVNMQWRPFCSSVRLSFCLIS